MSPSDNYEEILRKHKADPDSLLSELNELKSRCKHGIDQEKVSAKDGVLTVVEKYPSIELQINRLKWEMWQALKPKQEEAATQLELFITDLTQPES